MGKWERRMVGSLAWWTLGTIILVLLLVFAQRANAQEQYIRACQTSYACQLTPPGGTSWAAGVQTYVFTPMSPDVSLRINVHNQNTTSAHTAQTITLWITGSTTANFSLLNNADRWVQAAVIQNSTANASCTAVAANNSGVPGASGQGTCYAQGMYAAQIAIQFTPGGAQAGTVDNFDIDIVQCTANHCNYPGGPQPGNDSSAGGGGGTLLATNGASSQSASSRTLQCILAGAPVPCNIGVAPVLQTNPGTSTVFAKDGANLFSMNNGTANGGIAAFIGWKISSNGGSAVQPGNPLPVAIYPAQNPEVNATVDPCRGVLPSSVPIALSSATTTLLVALSGSTKIFVCSFSFTMVGAAETIKFVYGTQVTNPCDTGQVALTGAYADGTASDIVVAVGGPYTQFSTIAAQQLCAVTTGTVGIQGVLTFVQQ